MKPTGVLTMASGALRREIAERLGYRMTIEEFDGGEMDYVLKDPNGEWKKICSPLIEPTENAAWAYALAHDDVNPPVCPNWPEDDAAALALCAEEARRLCCELELEWWPEPGCRATFRQGGVFLYGGDGETTALALSRLALEALRARSE